jgi:amino-acid N-acetyltransferase
LVAGIRHRSANLLFMTSSQIRVRAAQTGDVDAIMELRRPIEGSIVLLSRERVVWFEQIQEIVVAVDATDRVVGAGALHVMWQDLAEVRSLVVAENMRGKGVGHAILNFLLERAAGLGIKRVFCLTFETSFFGKHGFEAISDVPVDAETYEEMLRSHDDGVAEFLDLARVKQNTLGNTRMLKLL